MRLQRAENCRKSLWDGLRRLSRTILDYIICIYLVLMLAVFPFYNEAGYDHIGTDKSTFFCRLGVSTGKILVIPLVLCLIAESVIFIRRHFAGQRFIWRKSALQKQQMRISPTDIFALVYCAALILSYACTDYKEEALWGAKGWNMGLLPQLMLICIYFLVSRFWTPRKWIFYVVLPASGAVFLMGCVNRFGIYSFGLEFVNAGYISTIGNQNWYCGYAVSVVFAGVVLLWLGERIKVRQRALLMVYIFVGYLSLVLQGSDSGLAALAVVMLVMFFLSAGEAERMLVFWQEMVLLWGGCLGLFMVRSLAPGRINFIGGFMEKFTCGPVSITMTVVSVIALILVWTDRRKGKYREKLFRILAKTAVWGSVAAVLGVLLLAVVNTLCPGILGRLSENTLFTFNTAWGSSRGATWSAGWKCFAAQDALHKLAGVGPDCMWSYINSEASPEIYAYVKELFSSQRLTNAHNEWLTILVDTGILGLVGYGGMMVCGMGELMKKRKENPIAAACGFCLLAYTVNNIFSFQQSMGVGTVFVIFGMGKAFLFIPVPEISV
ncbi:MAG: O-antigen ligase family protein [Acetatifactor sp.]|nr:O-antigen ligase family protein [Acetatifactor sp.]